MRLAEGHARRAGRWAASRTAVKSHHHQGVDELGEGVVASGWADGRTTCRGDRAARQRRYALGVLWHPEEDERSRVIGSLVAAAREHRAAAAPTSAS